MQLTESTACRVSVDKSDLNTENWKWLGAGPQCVNVLQASRLVAPEDIGKFVVSAIMEGSTHHKFLTPSKVNDRMWWWTNGLDRVESLAEGFQLFATAEEASAAVQHLRREESIVYEVMLEPDDATEVVFTGRMRV